MVKFMEKSRQEKKELRRKQEDATLNKLLIWFGAAIVYEAVALLLKRYFIEYNGTDLASINLALGLSKVLWVLQFAAPVLTIAAIVWYVLCRRQGKPARLPLAGIWVMAALSVTAIAAYQFRDAGVKVLGMVAPITAVLALIYFLYQKEFFCNTLLTGVGIVALLVYRKYYFNHPRMIYFGFVLVWLGMAAVVFLAWRLSQNNGRWGNRQIAPAKTAYVPTYLTAGLSALTLAVTLVAQACGTVTQAYGSTAAYYAIFVLITWLFCMAVYYTVRMM